MSGRRGESGFTVLEVMIAGFLVCVATLVFATAVAQSLRAAASARERSVALAVAQERMERAIADVALIDVLGPTGLNEQVFHLDGLLGGRGNVRYDLLRYPLIGIEVTITWKSQVSGGDRPVDETIRLVTDVVHGGGPL